MDCKKLDMDKLLAPVWDDNGYAYLESFFPVMKEGQTEEDELEIQLLYDVDEVVELMTATHEGEFEAGKDYFVRDGKLVIPQGSSIKRLAWDDYRLTGEKESRSPFGFRDGGHIFFGEGDTMHSRQYVVTYKHSDTNKCFNPTCAVKKLPGLQKMLKNKTKFTFAWYGDSITTGANSSGTINSNPGIPMFPIAVTELLKEKFDMDIEYVNKSMGGAGADWAINNYDRLFEGIKPDVMFIAYGMNDGGTSPEDEAEKIKVIVDKTLALNPDCEFLICSTTVPNYLANGFWGTQEIQEPALAKLCEELGDIAVLVPMGTMHKSLLERKNFYDMTGNNINHPNDYLARVYGQAILAQIL